MYPQGTLSLRERLRDSVKDVELMNGRVQIQHRPLEIQHQSLVSKWLQALFANP